jgi:uroporphyrin-3 C-methyltransferase
MTNPQETIKEKSTESSKKEAQEKPPARKQKKQTHKNKPAGNSAGVTTKTTNKSSFISLLALIIATTAIGAGYIAWQQINTQHNNLDSRLNETENSMTSLQATSDSSLATVETAQRSSQSLQNQMTTLEDKIDADISKLGQNYQSLNESLASISSNMREKKSAGWLVEEARHLINIANHQAQLNQDKNSAIAALEVADQRLRDAADPTLIKTRQIITDDIIALRSIEDLDIAGISLTLSQLEDRIEQLPLDNEFDNRTMPAKEAGETITVTDFKSFANKIWNDVKSLVSIRRSVAADGKALIPPDQHLFLQQNLRLKLETARLALLQRNSKIFNESLNTARTWINNYFNTEAAATASMLTSLASYEDLDLEPTFPDLSNSLRTLDEWDKQHNSAIHNHTPENNTEANAS